MIEIVPQDVILYETPDGKVPYQEWFDGLHDNQLSGSVLRRINRLRSGNFGDHRVLGEGLFELRIHDGPGLRIYYGRIGNRVVIVLSGGDKSWQLRDIHRAHMYWREYKGRPQ